jgi:folate-binding protein YgfZ
MSEEATQALRAILLPHLTVLRAAGPDAVTFLQGQFTHDTRLLADGRTQLAACTNSHGRVIAIARLRQTDDAIYMLLPTELATRLVTHLRKFVLRAKVALVHAHDLQVGAIVTGTADAGTALAKFEEGVMTMSPVPMSGSTEVVTFLYAPGREIVAAPPAAWRAIGGLSLTRPSPRAAGEWLAADIRAGLPQVFAATSEQFVPQMLNLDLIDGISFTKGCYSGQEIVARTQHLGRIKRRTQRYRLADGPAPAPMQGLYLDGNKVSEVLMCADVAVGAELLAVTNLDARSRELQLEDGRKAVPAELPYPIADKH